MDEERRKWGFWTVMAVASILFAAGDCAFLAYLADHLLPSVIFGSAAALLLFLALYEATTGRLLAGEVKEKEEDEAGETFSLKAALQRGGALGKEKTVALIEGVIALFHNIAPFFAELNSPGKGPSYRQKQIQFEDVLSRPVPEVKKRLREEKVDLYAVLKTEKEGQNRKGLVRWLEERVNFEERSGRRDEP